MDMVKDLMMCIGKRIASFSLKLGVASSSQACVLWFYQPPIPEEIKNYKEKLKV